MTAVSINTTLQKLYSGCNKLVDESRAKLAAKKKFIILSANENETGNLVDQDGKIIFKFIGGPGHGERTTIKNDTAWIDLQDGSKAFYFFLEAENCYHWKFWLDPYFNPNNFNPVLHNNFFAKTRHLS